MKEKNETGSLTIPDFKLRCKAVGKPGATSGSDNAPPRGDLPALRLPPAPSPQHGSHSTCGKHQAPKEQDKEPTGR